MRDDIPQANEEPVYLAIRRKICEGIERGVYPAGSAIPSENQLAREFGTTRRMVRNAVDALVEQGAIRRVMGKGAFVVPDVRMDDSVLGGFREAVRMSDGVPSVRVVGTSHRSAPGAPIDRRGRFVCRARPAAGVGGRSAGTRSRDAMAAPVGLGCYGTEKGRFWPAGRM